MKPCAKDLVEVDERLYRFVLPYDSSPQSPIEMA
jgi:hypothetical protein